MTACTNCQYFLVELLGVQGVSAGFVTNRPRERWLYAGSRGGHLFKEVGPPFGGRMAAPERLLATSFGGWVEPGRRLFPLTALRGIRSVVLRLSNSF